MTRHSGSVPVTIDIFIRAASDNQLDNDASLAGGAIRFFHFREPTPVDNQTTIRMNRDTLYSNAVVDISEWGVKRDESIHSGPQSTGREIHPVYSTNPEAA